MDDPALKLDQLLDAVRLSHRRAADLVANYLLGMALEQLNPLRPEFESLGPFWLHAEGQGLSRSGPSLEGTKRLTLIRYLRGREGEGPVTFELSASNVVSREQQLFGGLWLALETAVAFCSDVQLVSGLAELALLTVRAPPLIDSQSDVDNLFSQEMWAKVWRDLQSSEGGWTRVDNFASACPFYRAPGGELLWDQSDEQSEHADQNSTQAAQNRWDRIVKMAATNRTDQAPSIMQIVRSGLGAASAENADLLLEICSKGNSPVLLTRFLDAHPEMLDPACRSGASDDPSGIARHLIHLICDNCTPGASKMLEVLLGVAPDLAQCSPLPLWVVARQSAQMAKTHEESDADLVNNVKLLLHQWPHGCWLPVWKGGHTDVHDIYLSALSAVNAAWCGVGQFDLHEQTAWMDYTCRQAVAALLVTNHSSPALQQVPHGVLAMLLQALVSEHVDSNIPNFEIELTCPPVCGQFCRDDTVNTVETAANQHGVETAVFSVRGSAGRARLQQSVAMCAVGTGNTAATTAFTRLHQQMDFAASWLCGIVAVHNIHRRSDIVTAMLEMDLQQNAFKLATNPADTIDQALAYIDSTALSDRLLLSESTSHFGDSAAQYGSRFTWYADGEGGKSKLSPMCSPICPAVQFWHLLCHLSGASDRVSSTAVQNIVQNTNIILEDSNCSWLNHPVDVVVIIDEHPKYTDYIGVFKSVSAAADGGLDITVAVLKDKFRLTHTQSMYGPMPDSDFEAIVTLRANQMHPRRLWPQAGALTPSSLRCGLDMRTGVRGVLVAVSKPISEAENPLFHQLPLLSQAENPWSSHQAVIARATRCCKFERCTCQDDGIERLPSSWMTDPEYMINHFEFKSMKLEIVPLTSLILITHPDERGFV